MSAYTGVTNFQKTVRFWPTLYTAVLTLETGALLHYQTRNAAVVRKRTTAVYAEGGRNPLFKCVSQWQK